LEGRRTDGSGQPFSDDGWCYVCGPHNPQGLRLDWTLDENGTARARFRADRVHQGWRGVVHGGILAALLDEAMAQCAWKNNKPTVTGSIEIRYRRPAPTTAMLLAEGRLVADRGRALRMEALVKDESTGTVYADARGTCFRIRPLDNHAEVNGGRE
jgi:uncharacterized protein (TIGR00369 family)